MYSYFLKLTIFIRICLDLFLRINMCWKDHIICIWIMVIYFITFWLIEIWRWTICMINNNDININTAYMDKTISIRLRGVQSEDLLIIELFRFLPRILIYLCLPNLAMSGCFCFFKHLRKKLNRKQIHLLVTATKLCSDTFRFLKMCQKRHIPL